MKKKIETLSKIAQQTLSAIKVYTKRNKQAPIVNDIAFDLDLSWAATMARVKTLIKAKKVVRNKKGELLLK